MKKIISALFLCCMLLAGSSVNVLANDKEAIHQDDLGTFEQEEFEKLIDKIIEMQKSFPQLDDKEIEKSLDQQKSISDIWGALTPTEKKLVIRYPLSALQVNKAKNIAVNQTEIKFGYNGLGDRSDAFRHGLWNAEMTVLIGAEKAELFATAHEDKDLNGNESDGYSKIEHKNMDLHNNEVGRRIGSDSGNLTEDMLSEKIYNEVMKENTEFVWLHE